jgi:hypothetical protein
MVNRWWAFDGDHWSDDDLASMVAQRRCDLLGTYLQDDDEEYINGIQVYHRIRYICDIILNESDVVLGIDAVEAIIGNAEPPAPEDKLSRKVYNLNLAINMLFPLAHPLLQQQQAELLTPDTIRNVHRVVMDGLLPNAGDYRRNEAAPAGYGMYYYKGYQKIPRALAALCAETVRRLATISTAYTADDVKSLAAIGGDFLGKFLDIHPFPNGNGRVGRLVLSSIMSGVCIVPLSLNLPGKKKSRDIYLDILKDARLHIVPDYTTLHSFILEAAARNIRQLQYLLSDD